MIVTFRQFFLKLAETYSSDTAFIYQKNDNIFEVSYTTLYKDILHIASLIQKEGLQGRHIGLYGPNSYEWYINYYGCIVAGAVAVPLNWDYTMEEIREAVHITDIEYLIYDETESDVIRNLSINNKIKTRKMGWFKDTQSDSTIDDTDANSCACILLTSGTTGKSKGVMLSQRNMLSSFEDTVTGNQMKALLILPLHHISGLYSTLYFLHQGNRCFINQSLKYLYSDIQQFKPNLLFVVPAVIDALNHLFTTKERFLLMTGNELKQIICVGATLKIDKLYKLLEYGVRFSQLYGLTETSGPVTECNSNDILKESIGMPIHCNQLIIQESELRVSGENVMIGYYNNPEETQKVFIQGWFATGDLVKCDQEGYYYITGRKKNLIILENGENVSPEKIENQLYQCPYIKEVMVYEMDHKICAELFTGDMNGDKEAAQEMVQSFIKEYNRASMTHYRIQKIIYRDLEFDKTPSGKIKRKVSD